VLPCILLLLGAVTLLYLLLTPVVLWLQGVAGLRPAATAALVSMLAGVMVVAVAHQPGLRNRPLISMFLATTLRMVPLLAIGVTVAVSHDKRGHFDFICYLVVFYLAALAVETYASVQLVRMAQMDQNLLPHSRETQA